MNITSRLFQLARRSADARAAFSGSPAKIARRAKNKFAGRLILGRLLGRFWRLPR